jgi:hypothetical protein
LTFMPQGSAGTADSAAQLQSFLSVSHPWQCCLLAGLRVDELPGITP